MSAQQQLIQHVLYAGVALPWQLQVARLCRLPCNSTDMVQVFVQMQHSTCAVAALPCICTNSES